MPFRMPAEWEPHRATWIAWPHHEPDWPGKFASIPWVYAEIARVIADHEPLEILCASAEVEAEARTALESHGVRLDRVRLHRVRTDRVWLRDSAPTAVLDETGDVVLVDWAFNAWAKYDNWAADDRVGVEIAAITGLRREQPQRDDGGARVVLEGGGLDVNGDGLLLVTEEWLLGAVQDREDARRRRRVRARGADRPQRGGIPIEDDILGGEWSRERETTQQVRTEGSGEVHGRRGL
jgi:agmatine deiminase